MTKTMMTTTTTTTTSGSNTTSSFPIGSSVLLQNLVNGSQFNDKKGIVKSRPDSDSGRQEVYVFEARKSMAIKPVNLRYEPRELSSLSVSEMKSLLQMLHVKDNDDNNIGDESWSGIMDKQDLRLLVLKVVGPIISNDPVKIAELVARSNEPKENNNNNTLNTAVSSSISASLNSSQLRQGAERMSQMSPDEIRQQAATMKAMGPAALRAMNPQMAHMSDEQINMAIAQMESVANDPNQLKMAAEQMKNMSEDDLRRAMNLGGSSTSTQTSSSSSSSSSNKNKSSALNANNTTANSSSSSSNNNNISKTQFEHAAQQMSSLSPTQLRQQAAMLRSMSYDTLRKTNPPMAHMTDSQIEMSIKQLEQMAENPELMKLAADQMKSMTEEQYESVKQMLGGSGGNGPDVASTFEGANNVSMPLDSSKSNIMQGLLSNPEQLNSIVRTMKKNSELLKQVMVSQCGGPNVPEKQKEQLSKAIDSFVQMDDEKMERYLRIANGVQRMLKPIVMTFDGVQKRSGLSTRTLMLLIVVGMLVVFVIVIMKIWMWWNNQLREDGSGAAASMLTAEEEDESGMETELIASYDDVNSEF